MIYRVDRLSDCKTDPAIQRTLLSVYGVFILTDSKEYQQLCGATKDFPYLIQMSRFSSENWKLAICDFIDFCNVNKNDAIVVLSETDFAAAQEAYSGHKHNDPFLRNDEPLVLVHSTPLSAWKSIQRDGVLKSWNRLKAEKIIDEAQPIGAALGDPSDFSNYIMFGSGTTGEIVVNSKQLGKIEMNENTSYLTGARLYFDAEKIAADGLLIRDGCHLKVKDMLPLTPYLIWTATWDVLGFKNQWSTPKIFAEQADQYFQRTYNHIIASKKRS